MLVTPVLLSLERRCCHSQMHSRQGNCVSLCNPVDPQTALSAPRSLPSFTTEAKHDLGDGVDLQNFRLCALTLIKTYGGQLLFSQSMVLGNSSSVQSSACAFTLSLFLPHFYLHDQGSLPFTAPQVLFSPKSTLCSSYIPRCGCFSTSNCAVLFSQSSDRFYVCSK